MSGNIDRRVVEMRFDNKDFEKNTQDTITILDKLKEKLSFKNAGKDFDSSGLTSSVDRVAKSFSALEVVGMTTLVNLTNSAVNLGKHLAKSLTIDQVHAGFSEYELKMGSVQTIMASTGESIDVVNKKLNELNAYSDRTIYSFSDMTSNIGKFTNAGVNLNDAVNAMKGISNEAALAGANANEASRAMYNFSQALSAGFVMNRDWMSIENANMATKGFKQQLIDTAVAMGTLTKTEDGYISTTTNANGRVSEAFDATSKFRDSLQAQWLTTDVLTQTLNNYSVDLENMTDAEVNSWRQKMKTIGYTDEQIAGIEKLSKEAYAAAQDVKTFSQLMDTVKESIGSGWAQTFELLFGNLEEAKVLWTSINNVISSFVNVTSGARNSILQTWKDLGGRKDIADGLKASLGAVAEAFKQVFPAPSERRLADLGRKLKEITQGFARFGKLIAGDKDRFVDIFQALEDVIHLLKDAFKGLFDVLNGGGGESALVAMVRTFIMLVAWMSRGVSAIISFGRAIGIFKVIHGILLAINDVLFAIIDRISSFALTAQGALGDLNEPLNGASKGFNNLFNSINVEKLGILDGASKIFSSLAKGLGSLFSIIGKGLSKVSLGDIGGLLAGGGLFAAGMKLSSFISKLTKKIEKAKNTPKLLDSIKESLGELSESLKAFQIGIKAKALLAIASAVALLAAACYTLASIPTAKLAASVAAIGFLMGELTTASMFMKAASVKGIIQIAAAIYILSKALQMLAEVEDIGKGLGAIAGIMIELVLFFNILGRIKINPSVLSSFAKSMIQVAIALGIMVIPIRSLGSMNLSEIGKGLLGVGGSLLTFAGFFALMQSKVVHTTATRIRSISGSLILFAAALTVLSVPIKILGKMKIQEIGKGLLALAGALTVIGVFIKAMSTLDLSAAQILAVAGSLTLMGVAINIMAVALMALSSFDAGSGLTTLFGTLLILGVAVKAFQGSLPGAAAMIVVAGAIMLLAPAIALLSGLSLQGVAVGLLALAGSIAVLGAAAYILGSLWAVMLPGAAIMAALGAASLALGAGMLMLGMAFSTMLGPIINGVIELSKTLPAVFSAIGKALGAFFEAIVTEVPKLGPVIESLLQVMGDALIKYIPMIANIGITLVVELMKAIDSKISDFTKLAIDITIKFIDALSSRSGEMSDAGFNLLISFFNGTADAISKNGPRLIKSINNIILSMIEVLAGTIPIFGKQAAAAIKRYRESLDSGSGSTKKAAKNISKGVEEGSKISESVLKANAEKPMSAMNKVVDKKGKELTDKAKKISKNSDKNLEIPSQVSNGRNAVQGIIDGMDALIPSLRSKSAEIGNIVDETIRKKNQIASPSKRLAKTGKYMMQGLLRGLDSLTPEYQNRANNISTVLINSTNEAAKALSSFNGLGLTGAISTSQDVNLRMTDIRKENDKLANGLYKLNNTLSTMTDTMNSRALNNYITIDGSADPEGFADDLIRSFRLNARTV